VLVVSQVTWTLSYGNGQTRQLAEEGRRGLRALTQAGRLRGAHFRWSALAGGPKGRKAVTIPHAYSFKAMIDLLSYNAHVNGRGGRF
jgi:hypothetical protein